MPLPHKLGTLTPVIYFLCAEGHAVLAPYSDYDTSACEYLHPSTGLRCGLPCHREGADSLPAIDKLQAKLTRQENAKFAFEKALDEAQIEAGRRRVTESLKARLYSAVTPEAEKDFIRAYLELREEKRARHHAKWEAYNVYIHAREHDIGNRRPDEERSPT